MRLMHAVIVEHECTIYNNWYFSDGDDQYDICTNFYEKWMIHDVHIKPADEDSVDSIPASDAYCLCRGGISELDNKYR